MPRASLHPKTSHFLFFCVSTLVLAAFVAVAASFHANANTAAALSPSAPSDPWTSSQTVLPAALFKELSDSSSASKPIVVCTGYHSLYHGGHVPSASFHGPAATPEGLADLKNWARDLPRNANLVVYCGCCPLEHCPNIRPAFEALRDMGFPHLRVLLLPTDFATDWVAKGYPIEKGD